MRCADFPQAHLFVAEDQPEFETIPAHCDDDKVMTFVWRLTWRERLSILFYGEVWHQVMTSGRGLQPQSLDVHQPSLYMDHERVVARREALERHARRAREGKT